ncbi:MAG: peptidase C15 [Oscillatoriaceae cyanobacterium Prado104]|jgi:pyroglutamyl-peptidase|nr:peptidase C15 [Oscillatoriaceae cyanobacterium Prado104]
MNTRILLTSFETWLPHHKSNSSDDLLEQVSQIKSLRYSLNFLRKLPVDFELAPNLAIAHINRLQPDAIICCGMAESRQKLSLESCAVNGGREILKTAVNLELLANNLTATEISHDAGKFVCEALYYAVLKHLGECQIETQCIFVHVPILTADNTGGIVADFLSLIHHLATNK